MADLDLYDWPEGLPQEVFGDNGPTYAPQDNLIRTSVTTGPIKRRRRFTAVPSDVTATVEMSEIQIAILEDFVLNKLNEVDQFNWVKFHTGEPAVYQFKDGWASVTLTWYAGDVWTVTMALELMP